jgi:hypothetical protein
MTGPERADLPDGDAGEPREGADDLKAPLIILGIIGGFFLLGLVLLAVAMTAG